MLGGKLIYLCPTVYIKYYSIPLSLCPSVHMYDSHTSGEKLWFVISGLKIRQRRKTRETLEMCLLPSVFIVLSFFFRLGQASSAAYHCLIAMETNDFGTSIERVKQTVNYVSYAHVCMIRLFKAILNNDDHWVVCAQRSVYLYQEQALAILNCCTL